MITRDALSAAGVTAPVQQPNSAAGKPCSWLAVGWSDWLDCDLQEGLRVVVRDGQQSPGWTRWNATALFPLLDCSNRHAKQTCELGLGQTDLFSGRRHRWEVMHTTGLTSLELANALQNLYSNAAMLMLGHLRFPRGSASERAPECCRPRSSVTGSAPRSLPALAAGSRSRGFHPASRVQGAST